MSQPPAPDPKPSGRRPDAQTRAGPHATESPSTPIADLQPAPLDRLSPQFTLRAIATGMVLGALLSACNIYTGLKLPWTLNMSVTAVVVGYGLWAGLRAVFGVSRWGLLENNINQTAASSGANVSSAGLVAAIPALTLLTGQTLDWPVLAVWVFSVCLVGTIVAMALRRQMIVEDPLPFAAGIATAQTLRELHARGAEAARRLAALGAAALVAGATKLIEYARTVPKIALPFVPSLGGFSSKSLTFGLDSTLLMYGIGGLIGMRVCASLLLGALVAWGILAPALIHGGYVRLKVFEALPALPAEVVLPPEPVGFARYDARRKQLGYSGAMSVAQRDELLAQSDDPGFRNAVERLYLRSQLDPAVPAGELKRAQVHYPDVVAWLLWPGATLMVVASLVSFAFSWRAAFAALIGRAGRGAGHRPADEGEPARGWFVGGLLTALVLSVVLQVSLFAIVWWAAVLGVGLSFLLAVVAGRVSGETNITPVGAMGKVTQLLFGTLVPANPTPNLMAANVTGGAASQCADLLHDLKTGYLVGAAPRWQYLAQICGALAGSLVGSAVYRLLIPNPHEQLLTETWPAPSVVTWKAVAELFVVGFSALPEGTVTAIWIAAAAAVLLTVAEKRAPKKLKPYMLSPASFGLAMIIQASTSMTMFAGAVLALLVSRILPQWSKRYLLTLCAGIVAGESLTGVGISLEQLLRN